MIFIKSYNSNEFYLQTVKIDYRI